MISVYLEGGVLDGQVVCLDALDPPEEATFPVGPSRPGPMGFNIQEVETYCLDWDRMHQGHYVYRRLHFDGLGIATV